MVDAISLHALSQTLDMDLTLSVAPLHIYGCSNWQEKQAFGYEAVRVGLMVLCIVERFGGLSGTCFCLESERVRTLLREDECNKS